MSLIAGLGRHGQRAHHGKKQSEPLVTHNVVLHFFPNGVLQEFTRVSTQPSIRRPTGRVRSQLLTTGAKTSGPSGLAMVRGIVRQGRRTDHSCFRVATAGEDLPGQVAVMSINTSATDGSIWRIL